MIIHAQTPAEIAAARVRIAYLENRLDQLKRLDPNGWATLADGSLSNYTLEQAIEEVEAAIRYIQNNA